MEDGEVEQYKLMELYPFRTSSSSNNCSIKAERRCNLQLILLGRTGAGKSAFGNFILRRRAFTSKLSCRSVTQKSDSQFAKLFGRQINVVDTPGLYNTEMSMVENAITIQDSLKITEPGPHAFLLLIKLGRFTDEEIKMITMYKIIFGPYFLWHTIIVFTHEDQTTIEEQKMKDFIEDFKGNPSGKALLDECHQRYILLNSKETNEEMMKENISTLLMRVDELSGNGTKYYAEKIDMNRDAILKQFENWTYNSRTSEQIKSVCIDQEDRKQRQEQEILRQDEDGQRQKETIIKREDKKRSQEEERRQREEGRWSRDNVSMYLDERQRREEESLQQDEERRKQKEEIQRKKEEKQQEEDKRQQQEERQRRGEKIKQQEEERHEVERRKELEKILSQEEERRRCEEELRGEEARKRRQEEERQWFRIFLVAAVAIATLCITKIHVTLYSSR